MLETRIVTGIHPCDLTPAQVGREMRGLLARGARLRVAGRAKREPATLLSLGYAPCHRLRLFDTVFYLSALRQEPNARFFVAYVMLHADGPVPGVAPAERELFARYFYKDASLIWRSASHYARSARENWIGKGDLKQVREPDGSLAWYTAEETTNLPLEIQGALDDLSRRTAGIRDDDEAIGLVLRRAPDDRAEPYPDFMAARRAAAADPANRVNGGEPVAWFERRNDPASLRFARGFEPDFTAGLLESTRSTSKLCGGEVVKHRVLSKNRSIQWGFLSAPRQVWLIPPQALTTELTSYGVRTIDVEADDDLFVPGWEYHYLDDSEDPPRHYSQIPEGYAGEISQVDPARADASPWLEALPVVKAFRRAMGLPRPRPGAR
jgi:hypothetical protein